MELRVTGKAGAAAVLLWPDTAANVSDYAPVVRTLEKSCRVLMPVFAPEETENERTAAVESALLALHDGRIWGAYGLRTGGSAVLALLAHGKLRVRTAVVEGAVNVPQGIEMYSGVLVHWKGSRDKAAEKSWERLHKAFPALRSLTLRKLKAGQDVVSIRPDIMAKRLLKVFGSAGTVRVSTLVPHSAARVWRQLNRRPAGKALGRLQTMQPLRRTDEDRTQIIEGSAKGIPLWSHMTRVEPCGEYGAVCVDQVEISAGKLTPAAVRAAKIYLKAVQKNRNRQMRKE